MHTHDHDHEHHGGHRHGPPPWARAMTGDDRPGRPSRRGRGFSGGSSGSFFGHGPRANRGDVRAAVLALLAEAPMHGYQIIGEIAERSGGVWTPSPGSVYPTLQHLEDEDLVTSTTSEGKKVFALTEAGRAANDARGHARAPWEEVGEDVDATLIELRDNIGQVANAVRQIARGGTVAQISAAKKVLVETRRSLYRILAEDDVQA